MNIIKTQRFCKSLSLAAVIVLVAVSVNCGGGETMELAGTLERRTLELSAPISEIIVEIPLNVGAPVEKDTIVVQLDTEVVAAELKAHEAGHAAAMAMQKEANTEFRRQENLRRARVASAQALGAARRKMDEARALTAEKEARIVQAKKRLRDLTIRSRYKGVIDQLPFEVGERTPAGGVVAVVIADENPWVRVWLPTRAVPYVNIGQPATVKVEGMKKWLDGKVEHISREPEFTPHYALTERESAHLVYESRVRLTGSAKDLPPGIPCRVRISYDTTPTSGPKPKETR